MADENITAQADAEPVEPTEEAPEVETSTEPSKEYIDYEAILAAERKRREDAEKKLAEQAFKQRQIKREDVEPEEEQPLTRRELMDVLRQERESTQKEREENKAFELARTYTSSETEAQAAVEFWKSRVVPTGNLEEDILFAIGGLNAKRLQAQNAELKRALVSKETRVNNPAGTQRDSEPAGEARLSPQDASALKAAGMIWDGTKRLYKKPLTGGKKFLYFDQKTKKRWVA